MIELEDEEEIDDVEKEVIDIDTPKKRSAGGAEGQPEAKKLKSGGDWGGDEEDIYYLWDKTAQRMIHVCQWYINFVK